MAEFTAVAHDGALTFDQWALVKQYLNRREGARLVVDIRQPRQRRSLDQNAWWWAEAVPKLAEHCGYTANQMHYALLGECFGYEDGPTGQPVPKKPSSSELSTQEFSDLITWVLIWAPSELGVPLESPDEWYERTARREGE